MATAHAHGSPAPLRSASFTVTGLECADCARQLATAVGALPGVVEADAVFATARLRVVFKPGEIGEDRVTRTIGDLGYGTKREQGHTAGLRAEYVLDGLDCGDCAVHVEDVVAKIPGVREARVNFGAAMLEVVFEEAGQRPDVAGAVAGLGYQARLREGAAPRPSWRTRRRILAMAVSGLAFAAGLVAERLWPPGALPLFGLAVVAGGFYMARAALVALRTSRGLDINFLMTIAVLGAIALGRWEEAAEVVCLFAAGNALAASTMDRTRAALRGLLQLAPPTATVRDGRRESEQPVADVPVGARVVVRPGDRVPLDGQVVEGQSAVDESALTGEAMPVAKAPGQAVYAGSMNGRGVLVVEVARRADDGALARIVHMVEEAQAQRAPIQQTVDRFARLYTPAILVVAAVLAAGPALLGWPDPLGWVYQAIALLVVACPCALVVSTPVAVAAAIGAASRRGLLIKGGAFLEALGTVDAVAFDKTGTLTAGRPSVTEVVASDGRRPDELLALAAALEHHSEHPLAEAILRKHHEQAHERADECCDHGDEDHEGQDDHGDCEDHEGRSLPRPGDVGDFEAFPGRGVAGTVGGKRIVLGNPPFMAEQGIAIDPLAAHLEAWRGEGKTPVVVAEAGQVLGALAISDMPRAEAPEALASLRRAGIRHIAVLTGDHAAAAGQLARSLGADEVLADLMPDDKVKAVRDLLARHGRVAMVGDGINDAPALATSTVGVAMGARGSDAALETADVVLMQDDLRLLAPAVRLGREAMAIIRQNIAFSLAIKVILVALAVPQILTLGMAVLGDVGTTLLVILNGMRLLRAKAFETA